MTAFICTHISTYAQSSISIVKSAAGISTTSLRNMDKKTIDSAYMECRYELRFIRDTTAIDNDSTKKHIVKEDLMLLLVGKDVSKFYSYNKFYSDSIMAATIKERSIGGNNSSINISDVKVKGGSSDILYKYSDGGILFHTSLGIDNYQYEEKELNFEWELEEESKELLGYTVYKATCDFRGRHYIAWYAPEISISNGPWKFGGLPGFILEVYDSRSHYHYTAVGLRKVSDIPIEINEGNFIKIKREKYLVLKKRSDEDPIGFMNNNSGGRIKINVSGEGANDLVKKLKYDYQERDY